MEWISVTYFEHRGKAYVGLALKGCSGEHRYPRRWRERAFPVARSSEAAVLNQIYEWIEAELLDREA